MKEPMKAEKEQKYNARRIKGITLIALVITIIVLLILAAVSITAVFGDNGLLQMAKDAGKKTNLSTLEELANTKYLNKQTNSWINGTSADITMQEVVAELEKAGYDIITDTQGKEVSEITLTPNTITMEINSTEEITVAYTLTEGTNKYYAKVDGKYYEMTIGNSGITVSREESKVNEGTVTEPTITAESEATDIVTVEVSEKTITVTSKDQVGNTTITVTCEGKTKDCGVIVTPEPNAIAKEYGKIQDNNKNITEGDKTLTIPAGFKVVDPKIDTTVEYEDYYNPTIEEGIVIADEIGNEFVWVPVENPEEMYGIISKEDDGTKHYAGKLYDFTHITNGRPANLNWENVKNDDKTNRTEEVDGIIVDWITWLKTSGTNINHEPDTLDKDNEEWVLKMMGFDNITQFKTQLQKEFDYLVVSVNKYKGFYIGRYETGINNIPVVQKENTNIIDAEWYSMYLKIKNISLKNTDRVKESVTSSIIWGSQWDEVMNWFLKDEKTRNYVTDINGKGNYSGTQGDEDKIIPTGSNRSYKVKNIYDMAGNAEEFTMEVADARNRVLRGGNFLSSKTDCYASFRSYDNPNVMNDSTGVRSTLIVNL